MKFTTLVRVFAFGGVLLPVSVASPERNGAQPNQVDLKAIYGKRVPAPAGELQVFHLGHSLVGRNMPAFLQQLAGGDHDYRSQLGWGATLKSHWDPDVEINGFEFENQHNKYQDVHEAIVSGELDAFVMTEMVEIKDAIRYFDSANYLHEFAAYISRHSPQTRVFLYESWHHVDDERGWFTRLDEDYPEHWLGQILYPALARSEQTARIHVIPVGQVLAAFFRVVEERDGVPGITQPEDIFIRNDDGTLDAIHVNDIGMYLVALVHYAVLYQRSPEGLQHQLARADGTPATAPSAEAAALMQQITWDVVSRDFHTGLIAHGSGD